MFKDRYMKKKADLLSDDKVNSNNRQVMDRFLQYEEYKLKRKEGLSEVDERSYKTLYGYAGRLRKLNEWLKNKDWTELTEEEIKKLIDDLEDGNLKNKYGRRYSDRSLYYQMMQGRLFALVGKSHIVRNITEEFSIRGREFNKEVRFIDEETVRKIIDCAITPEHRCLMWVAYDTGENICSLLSLEKDDFKRQINPDSNEPEYVVVFSKENLKRSRTPRSEITNYKETVSYLDIVLNDLKPSTKKISNKYMDTKNLSEIHNENKLFKFGFKAAETLLKRAVEKAHARCLPGGQRVTWKDLRSSMACDLLNKGWSRDEVNARLGHRPSSRIIDSYINYLALDRKGSKKKLYDGNLRQLEVELEQQKEANKLQGLRFENLRKEQEQMKEEFNKFINSSKVELIKMMKNLEEKPIIVSIENS